MIHRHDDDTPTLSQDKLQKTLFKSKSEIFLKINPLSDTDFSKQGKELLYELPSDNSISLDPSGKKKQSLAKTVYQFSKIFESTVTQQE